MVKRTQTICRQFADELFECIWPFCGIGAQRVKSVYDTYYTPVIRPLIVRTKMKLVNRKSIEKTSVECSH